MESLRIAYAGTPEFAVPALTSIKNSPHKLVAVLTQPDRKSGRGRKITKSAVKQSLSSDNVLILQPENVNDDEVLSRLSGLNIDLLVVAAYGQIFSQKLLNLPKLGCINIHASLLPKWRGASPIQNAILAGDNNSGITIMQMQLAMDAGDIWMQSECPINDEDTALNLHDRLAKLSGKNILEAIDLVSKGTNKPSPQSISNVSYCSKLTKCDGLIEWNEPTKVILRKVRAFYPWPGTYTHLNGRRLRIIRAELGNDDLQNTLRPGSVSRVSKRGISVVTGDSTLVISELVPEGGKRVSAADFSNANVLDNQVFE